MPDHAPQTFIGDRVLFFSKGKTQAHVAFVTATFGPHTANVVFYCPVTHAWKEANSVAFGKADDRDYFVNPEG